MVAEPTAATVDRWLEEHHQESTHRLNYPVDPDSSSSFSSSSLSHPADAFPLATFSNPPSSTTASATSELHHLRNQSEHVGDRLPTRDDARPHVVRSPVLVNFTHQQTLSMDGEPATQQARRRSSSLASVNVPARKESKKHRRHRSDHIPEEGEDDSDSGERSRTDSSSETDSTDFELDDMSSRDGLEDDEETGLTGRDRRRRRRRKRRNTRLDQRIVEEVKFGKDEEKLANENLIRSMLINALLIGLWYLFSISISVYNKWMFKTDKGDGQTQHIFPFPLFTTCLHMIVQFTLSSLVLFMIPSFRPRHDSLTPADSRSREPVDTKKPLMTKWFYFSRIGPCGAATGMDIGLGNMSLKFISLTFFTMCKSSALGFVLIFAFLFRLEQPSWRLVLIICVMTVGVVMMVAGETAFHVLGFILVMASACSSGFRWSLTQILLLRNPATSNPFSSIFFLAPVMFVSLFILAVPVEGFGALSEGLSNLFAEKGVALGIGILLFPGTLAFFMTSSEFALLKRTSVVTLSICGIFKEVVTITTANLVFKDPLTPINITGLFVTILSIAAYNWIKFKKMRDEARMKAHISVQEDYQPVRTRDPDSGTVATSSSARNPLRAAPSLPPSAQAERPATDAPSRASPVKRPEDLE